ncbi:MAG: hypothetical protein HY754_01845 [Nitrospirae bacterium]|nr:hypothetical protein [Nitrospirota bacterium]
MRRIRKDTFDLSFDEREKLIDGKVDKGRCKILQKHIEEDPEGISVNNYHPEETSLCLCGACTTLCRDEKGDIKIFSRQIKSKRGVVDVKEYGYYCSKCRKVFFPSPKKAKTIQRKL